MILIVLKVIKKYKKVLWISRILIIKHKSNFFFYLGYLVEIIKLEQDKQIDISDGLLFLKLHFSTSSITNLFTSS